MQSHFAQSKVIGVNFMIPKTNRVYVNLKTIYRNKEWGLIEISCGIRLDLSFIFFEVSKIKFVLSLT